MAGPLAGTHIAVAEGETSIGRELGNRLVVNDAGVSRQHAALVREGSRVVLRDLDSLNGSLVNGVPVRERELAHGDQVEIGESLFLYLTHDEEPAPSPVRLLDGEALLQSTLRLPPAASALPISSSGDKAARDLEALRAMSRLVASARRERDLWEGLLDVALPALGARRGAVVLTGGTESAFAKDRLAGPGVPVPVSRTVIEKVLGDREALLLSRVAASDDGAPTRSLLDAGTRSALAAPLLDSQGMHGVVYLDTTDPSVCFDRRDLELLAGIAGLAGLSLSNLRHIEWLEGQRRSLTVEARAGAELVGESAAMLRVYQLIEKVARSDANVLLLGESGTGKELAARAIHSRSARAERPFVAINCAALTETLLESELFGHERGAFTGAIVRKRGRLETADGGTVLLDEVGELPLGVQAKLLRFLESRELVRVGGGAVLRVDVRIVAATNRDLSRAVKRGAFREDLFYRLNVVSIEMPPLRQRREDVSLLVSYFVARHAKRLGKRMRGISPGAQARLVAYDWPGNVRELSNVVERAVVLSDDDLLRPEDLPESLLEGAAASRYHEALDEAKRKTILAAVEESRGNLTEAARRLGVNANYLHRLIRNLGLRDRLGR